MSLSVVVTGGGQGLGQAIARRLDHEGWHVVVVDRNERTAQAMADELGSRGAVVVGSVTEMRVLAHAARAARALAPLGGWVNNAAVTHGGNLHSPNRKQVDEVFSVNIGGCFWGTSAAVRAFIEQRSRGAVLNLSSIHARASFSNWAAYEASKGAVEALTRYTAVEYGPFGIRANAIAPGVVSSPGVEAYFEAQQDPDEARRAVEAQPLRRIGDEDEVAAAAAFLLSDEASYITGQTLAVDGGWSIVCAPTAVDPELATLFRL